MVDGVYFVGHDVMLSPDGGRRLLQRNLNIFLDFEGFNLFFAEQPTQTEVEVLVGQLATNLLKFLARKGTVFVEGVPDFTGHFARFDCKHSLL